MLKRFVAITYAAFVRSSACICAKSNKNFTLPIENAKFIQTCKNKSTENYQHYSYRSVNVWQFSMLLVPGYFPKSLKLASCSRIKNSSFVKLF